MKSVAYILILILFQIGCTDLKSEFADWQKIKDERDFATFFNFALETDDSELLLRCYDSLDKYKPEKYCYVLDKNTFYLPSNDSVYNRGFDLENHCGYDFDVKSRNVLVVKIDNNDSIHFNYQRKDYLDFESLMYTLLDTPSLAKTLPEAELTMINGTDYYAKNFGLFLHCRMFPDSLTRKTSWDELIKTTKQILSTYNRVRNTKSKEIYSRDFNELDEEKRKKIIYLIPIHFMIRFYYSYKDVRVPPPEPPNDEKGLDI